MFDYKSDRVYNMTKAGEVDSKTLDKYGPGGSTALLDSLALSINETGAELSKLEEADRPEKVLFVTITDGGENSSKEFGGNEGNERVKSMIALQKDVYKWDFDFIGADFDAFTGVSQGLGLAVNTAYNIDKRSMYDAISATVNSGLTCYRKSSLEGKRNLSEYMKEEDVQ